MSSEELSSSIRKLPTREALLFGRAGTLLKLMVPRAQLAVLCEKQETLTVAVGGLHLVRYNGVHKCPLSWNKYQSAELVHWLAGWLAWRRRRRRKKIRIRQTLASEGGVGHTGTTANSLSFISQYSRYKDHECTLIGECWCP